MIATWTCQACGLTVGDGEGSLWITWIDIQKASKQADSSDSGPMDILDLVARRDDEPSWHVTHFACDEENADGASYSIDVDRIRTPLQAHSWTFHLYGKLWGPRTNWHEVMLSHGLAQDSL